MKCFPSYVRIGPNRYRERFGLDFEDFAVGQKFRHRPGLNVTQQENVEEALDTKNAAQLHYDANYARKTEWEQNLVVSTLTLQRVVGMASRTYMRRHSIPAFDDITMTHPVFGGDTLYSESEVLAKEEYPDNPVLGKLLVLLRGLKPDGIEVARITVRMLIYRKGFHPEDRGLDLSREGLDDDRFSAYGELPDGTLMEQRGLYYEDLMPGEIYEHRPGKTLLIEESAAHALRSLEWGPQYSDLAFASELTGGMQMYEPFLLSAMITSSTHTFGRVVANLAWKDFVFHSPVRDRDTIYAESEIISKRDSEHRPSQGIMNVMTRAFNQHKERVADCNRTFLIYKRGLGPYKKAGY